MKREKATEHVMLRLTPSTMAALHKAAFSQGRSYAEECRLRLALSLENSPELEVIVRAPTLPAS